MAFVIKTESGVPVVKSELLERAGGVVHGFSTRQGGVSTGIWSQLNLGYNRGDNPSLVRENYRRFCSAIGANPDMMIRNRQVHGDVVRPVTAADVGGAPWEADGLVTQEVGLCLAIPTADCIPVLLYEPRRRCIAAVHSGWRGTAKAISVRAVECMEKEYGCDPSQILVAVGPGIAPCCFTTRADVPRAMTAAFGRRVTHCIQPLNNGTFRVDLKGIIVQTLKDAGLAPEHIDVCPHCTACMTDVYWSHRVLGNTRGSMSSLIALQG